MPDLDDLEARLAGLESKALAVSDLPLAQLKSWLEHNWNPSAGSVLEAGSITIDLLDSAIKFGLATTTWPGGSATSNTTTVLHGLGRTPSAVFTQSATIAAHARPTTITDTSFALTLRTVDGSLPAAGNATAWWLAL